MEGQESQTDFLKYVGDPTSVTQGPVSTYGGQETNSATRCKQRRSDPVRSPVCTPGQGVTSRSRTVVSCVSTTSVFVYSLTPTRHYWGKVSNRPILLTERRIYWGVSHGRRCREDHRRELCHTGSRMSTGPHLS